MPPQSDTLVCTHFDAGACDGCSRSTDLAAPPARATAAAWLAARGAPLPWPPPPVHPHCWRCRARLAVRPGGDRHTPVIGLFRAGTHDVAPIPHCSVHHPSINAVVTALVDTVRRLRTPLYSEEDPGAGGLRYIQATVAARGRDADVTTDPGAPIQLAMVWGWPRGHVDGDAVADELATALWAEHGGGGSGSPSPPLLHSIHHNHQPSPGNAILAQDGWVHAHGPPFAWQAAGGAAVAYSPSAFCQANPRAFSQLLNDIGNALEGGDAMPTSLIDLHAGAGAVGFALAARAGGPGGVTAVDVNPAGAAPFAASAARLQEDARSSGRTPPTLTFQATAARAAAAAGVLTLGDGGVVDPPRKGLDPALCALLATSPPPSLHTLVYISCHFPSLARDGDTILNGGRWALSASAARVFFPGADAVETAAVFVRR